MFANILSFLTTDIQLVEPSTSQVADQWSSVPNIHESVSSPTRRNHRVLRPRVTRSSLTTGEILFY